MIKKVFLAVFVFFLLTPLVFFTWWHNQTAAVNPDDRTVKMFVIPQGWGVDQIGQQLKEEGLINSSLAFKLMVLKQGIAKDIQAGDFRLSSSMNLLEISQALTHGTVDIWVTIPEGLRKEEIANILNKSFTDQGIEFNKKSFLARVEDLEGYLFPDTYLVPKTATVDRVVEIMQANFEKKFAFLEKETSLTKEQIVVLASLVEREAKYDKDRPVIAGILLKRLKKGWGLQVDATVQYAKASINCSSAGKECNWWPEVTGQDVKKINSSYNTYQNQGLPPTAICNPGLASLKAVVDSTQSEYWYYLSDKSGKIHYASTLEEHDRNIRKFLSP